MQQPRLFDIKNYYEMLALEVSRIRGILDDGIMARELNRAQQLEEARNRQARYEESRTNFFSAAAGAIGAGLNSWYNGSQNSNTGPQPPGYGQTGYPQPGYQQPGYPQPGYPPQQGYGGYDGSNNFGGYPLPPGFYNTQGQPPRR